jgi:DNA excision repair protein ERCC-6
MASSRKLKSILVISPATILQHWLKELAKWAPGLRRVLIHQSGEVDGRPRTITPQLLRGMNDWLKQARKSRLFEAIDEEDFESRDPSSFVGTGLCFVTTYENVRRNPDIWTSYNWDYIIMDEAQKIRNPDADVTLTCKVKFLGDVWILIVIVSVLAVNTDTVVLY